MISGDFPHSQKLRAWNDSLCGSCDNDTLDSARSFDEEEEILDHKKITGWVSNSDTRLKPRWGRRQIADAA